MTREQFDELWEHSDKTRELVDRLMAEHTELFPTCLRKGYALHGFARTSQKLEGIRLRKIRPAGGGQAYHLRPSFVMSYMTGTTDEVEHPLLLASYGVPNWVLTRIYGGGLGKDGNRVPGTHGVVSRVVWVAGVAPIGARDGGEVVESDRGVCVGLRSSRVSPDKQCCGQADESFMSLDVRGSRSTRTPSKFPTTLAGLGVAAELPTVCETQWSRTQAPKSCSSFERQTVQ